MRDSTSLKMIPYLARKGALISYYDPTGKKKQFSKNPNISFNGDLESICKNADLIVLHTEWDEFKSIDFKKISQNKKLKVFDLRNLYNYEEMLRKKISYYSIGRPEII